MDERFTTIMVKAAEMEHCSTPRLLLADMVAFEQRYQVGSRATVRRLLVVGALLPALTIAIVGVLRGPERHLSSHRLPLDFTLVAERYDAVRLFDTREEVEGLLGPPTQRSVHEPALLELMEQAEYNNRGVGVPPDRVWVRWTDPEDEGKSVTVLFGGGIVFKTFKKGF